MREIQICNFTRKSEDFLEINIKEKNEAII
jgi:hypothetical protein